MYRFFLILFCLLSLKIYSQEFYQEPDPKPLPGFAILKTNPLAAIQGPMFLVSEYRLCVEKSTAMGQSFQFSVSYLSKSLYVLLFESMQTDPYRFSISGVRFTGEYRLYPSKHKESNKAPEGFYIAPYVSWSSTKVSDTYSITFNEYIKATYQHACLKLGYQWIMDRFSLDIFTGIGYKNNVWSEHSNQTFNILDKEDFELFPGNVKVLFGFNTGMLF